MKRIVQKKLDENSRLPIYLRNTVLKEIKGFNEFNSLKSDDYQTKRYNVKGYYKRIF